MYFFEMKIFCAGDDQVKLVPENQKLCECLKIKEK